MTKSTHKTVTCYVALGSNMGDSQMYLEQAVSGLESHLQINQLKLSSFYQSKPHGPKDQPDYLNAAVCFETDLAPYALLDAMQKIENDNDRVRAGVVRWGARTLDLDLLFYGKEKINSRRLTVPHPRICERAFVLLPLRDLMEHDEKKMKCLKINTHTSILDCINNLSDDELNNVKTIASQLRT